MKPVPVSVLLPPELRARLDRVARKRALKLSTAIRVLVDERLKELEGNEELAAAEQWQRAQAWATWERIKAGEIEDISWADVDRRFNDALGRGESLQSGRPARSARTPKPRRGG